MSDVPVPARVGLLYDQLVGISQEIFGADFHFGYWPDPEADKPDGSLAAAALRMTMQVMDRLDISAGSRVLDVGCGKGAAAVGLARLLDVHVRGISVSGEEIRLANARAADEGVADRVRVQYGDATSPAFASATFDAAWAVESLCHVPDRATALAGLARVLRPGGRLVITDLVELAPMGVGRASTVAPYAGVTMGRLPTPESYRAQIESAGFRICGQDDLTRHVLRRTYTAMSDQVRTRRAELDRRYGSSLVDRFDLVHMSDIDEIGYHVFLVER